MSLPMEERIEHAVTWATSKRFLPGDIPMAMLKLRYALLKDAAVVLQGYKERPLGVPVHVWWADKTLEQYGAAPVQWQDYTTGVVQSGIVPGDHFGVVGNVDVLNQIANALADLESVGR